MQDTLLARGATIYPDNHALSEADPLWDEDQDELDWDSEQFEDDGDAESTESEEARFAQSSQGTFFEYIVPVNQGVELSRASHIPGCEGTNISPKAMAVSFRNHILVLKGGPVGFRGYFDYYDLIDPKAFHGAVFQQWHDDSAIASGTRTRGDNTGATLVVNGKPLVVGGLVRLRYTFPTAEAQISLEEAQKDPLGSRLSSLKEKGASFAYEVTNGFPILTIEHEGKIERYFFFRARGEGWVRRERLTEDELADFRLLRVANVDGQMSLF